MLTLSLVAALAAATSISLLANTASAAVRVRVGFTRVSPPVAPGFVGFSFELQAVPAYAGDDPHAINPVLVRLIRNLAPHQTPVLRIGGNSTDEAWWPAPGVTPTPGLTYTLTPNWLATTRALADATGAQMILGLNLKLDSPAELSAEAQAFETGIGRKRIAALEIGNEPELYANTPWYEDPAGNPIHPRPPTFNFAAYLGDISSLSRQFRGDPLAGPATGSARWVRRLPKLFAAERGLKVVTYHRYPLIRCFTKPGDAHYPSIPNLLNAAASRDLLAVAPNTVALVHRHHAAFRVDELNSVACSGQPGVSDTFASALWMLDTLFALARSGVDGVNIHTLPDAAYEPFDFQFVNGRWLATVRPEYYGLLLFTQTAPAGSRMLATAASPGVADLRTRATITPAGVINVALINDSLTAARVVQLPHPPGAGNRATLERLSAPSAAATDGVTLAGQSFGSETATGRLTGTLRMTRLTPVRGQYLIDLPPASAAMVSFAPPGAR